jgi:hypothetical protein
MKANTALYNSSFSFRRKLAGATLAGVLAIAALAGRGQVATNFTIINHATGQPLSLDDYQGSVIFLDFWAYWCEYCQAAAADIEPNLTRYYRNAGGNSNGLPVQVISVNIDCSCTSCENSYIGTYGLELVADDCNWVAYNQFNYGGIPQFAIINGLTNSVNYAPWQIVSSPTGYLTNYSVPLFKSYIDAVQTPAPIVTVTNPTNGTAISSSNIPLRATVTTNGKIIKKVEFYNGATLLGASTTTPYSLAWSNVSAGAKSVFARAYYGTSSSVDSAVVNFTVASPVVAKLSRQGTNVLLSWTGGCGNYQVQVATNLAGEVWQNCGTAGTNTSLVITRSNRAAFYRVSWP